jgi:transcriptional regulator with XRE-family HTH domain
MTDTFVDKLTRTPDDMRLFQQERAILETTEQICALMDEKGLAKSDLARKLGKSKGYITQLLSGQANMTLRTISDVFWALDSNLYISAGPLSLNTAARNSTQFVLPASTENTVTWGILQDWIGDSLIERLEDRHPNAFVVERTKDNQNVAPLGLAA